MKLKMMTMVGAVLSSMFILAGSAAAEERFSDLQHVKWAEDSITYMADRGTVAGVGNGKFAPEKPVTRAQAVTFLVRELYPEQLQSGAVSPSYTDVQSTHPFYHEIGIAEHYGLASGFPDGSFHPDAAMSRAETAAFLTRAYALSTGRMSVSLTDVQHHWAAEPIQLMSSNGLIGGYADGTYRPDRSVTRAEFSVFLARVIRFEREAAIALQDWDKLISYMTLSEQVGQMLMPDIRQWNGQATTTVNEGLKRTVQDLDLGGMILFDKNIVNARQVVQLTHDLQKVAGELPLFLGVDQEGGVIKRIPGGTNLPGQMALGASGDPILAKAAGKLTGEELRALGLQVNFAPVLDVNSNPDNPIIGMRSFSADADLVSRLGLATIQGLRQAGVIAAVKHFPGHGDTTVDSHLGLPVLTHNRERLDAVELKPFRTAIEGGVEMIMTAHIAFPAIENEHVTSLKDGSQVPIPATLSKKVFTGLLREELGYQGIIISDAFTMNGIAEHFGENQAVERAVNAGVDIILMPQHPEAAHKTLVQAVENGRIPVETIHKSVKRILELKAKYGLFDQEESLPQKFSALKTIGSEEHRAIEREIAERAVTVLASRHGENPDSIQPSDRVVIAATDKEQAEQLQRQLTQTASNRSLKTEIAVMGQGNTSGVLQKMEQADYVILASYQFRNVASEFGWSEIQTVVDTLNKLNKRYVLLSLGNPYETMYVQNVRSALAVYGKQEPNTQAAIQVLLGQLKAEGVLPVATQSIQK